MNSPITENVDMDVTEVISYLKSVRKIMDKLSVEASEYDEQQVS